MPHALNSVVLFQSHSFFSGVTVQDFEEEIGKVLSVLPRERRTFLFSATMTSKVAKLQRASLKDPVRVSGYTKICSPVRERVDQQAEKYWSEHEKSGLFIAASKDAFYLYSSRKRKYEELFCLEL